MANFKFFQAGSEEKRFGMINKKYCSTHQVSGLFYLFYLEGAKANMILIYQKEVQPHIHSKLKNLKIL